MFLDFSCPFPIVFSSKFEIKVLGALHTGFTSKLADVSFSSIFSLLVNFSFRFLFPLGLESLLLDSILLTFLHDVVASGTGKSRPAAAMQMIKTGF